MTDPSRTAIRILLTPEWEKAREDYWATAKYRGVVVPGKLSSINVGRGGFRHIRGCTGSLPVQDGHREP